MTKKSLGATSTKPRTLTSCLLTVVVMVVALGAATGCSTVAPYERGKLAHPTMSRRGHGRLRRVAPPRDLRGRHRRHRRHGQRLRLQLIAQPA
jgi:hypothetical protein